MEKVQEIESDTGLRVNKRYSFKQANKHLVHKYKHGPNFFRKSNRINSTPILLFMAGHQPKIPHKISQGYLNLKLLRSNQRDFA